MIIKNKNETFQSDQSRLQLKNYDELNLFFDHFGHFDFPFHNCFYEINT
ncbi:hypothetical protein SAMN04488097_0199 [Epilithonimonas lactis]|nr:hypothetical protein SAMN04488097_0199 [Epilithonimonas lactis]